MIGMELVDCRGALGAEEKRGFCGTSSMVRGGGISLLRICAQNPYSRIPRYSQEMPHLFK